MDTELIEAVKKVGSSFLLHNSARSRTNRTTRAQQSAHGGLKQYVCGSEIRIVRGIPAEVSAEDLAKHLPELREKAAQGLVAVTTLEGVSVDLDTFLVTPPAPASPAPRPPLDSAANDKNGGHVMGLARGETAPPKEFTMPVEAPHAALEDNPFAPVEEEFVEEEVVTSEDAPVPSVQKQGGRKSRRG